VTTNLKTSEAQAIASCKGGAPTQRGVITHLLPKGIHLLPFSLETPTPRLSRILRVEEDSEKGL